MAIAIDTSVLIDVLLLDPTFMQKSKEALREHASNGLIISEAALAEISPAIRNGSIRQFLSDWNIKFVPSSIDSAELAGRMYRTYLERGGKRGRIVPDFLIGAHARCLGTALLARDLGYYRDYFQDLMIIDPAKT
jgi:predicted nucleic acid-binding protein